MFVVIYELLTTLHFILIYQGDKLEEISKELEKDSLPVETIKKYLTLLLGSVSLGINLFFLSFFLYFCYCL
jgi:hypothetical protein